MIHRVSPPEMRRAHFNSRTETTDKEPPTSKLSGIKTRSSAQQDVKQPSRVVHRMNRVLGATPPQDCRLEKLKKVLKI